MHYCFIALKNKEKHSPTFILHFFKVHFGVLDPIPFCHDVRNVLPPIPQSFISENKFHYPTARISDSP
jgi:hypothetical protein